MMTKDEQAKFTKAFVNGMEKMVADILKDMKDGKFDYQRKDIYATNVKPQAED